ncbi:TetR/AcrR family transcriptional regulator [Seminibacterium arietis]|uniref:TetR/AcrR family transcriptional regulator n=1 Tax=Seminibacterium arietis TaxID=1173502 RepID=A0ABW3I7L5_9PAST
MYQSETKMTNQIFNATERLMASEGLHSLSMHKIAKEANISPGTIYIYFKNKDELLRRFARQIFVLFSETLGKNYDESLSFFEQYRRMWWNIWHLLKENPIIVVNMSQYKSLPAFHETYMEHIKQREKDFWGLFCQRGHEAGVLCDLSPELLFSLGLKSAINLALQQLMFNQTLSDQVLETVIERTWRSIQK